MERRERVKSRGWYSADQEGCCFRKSWIEYFEIAKYRGYGVSDSCSGEGERSECVKGVK